MSVSYVTLTIVFAALSLMVTLLVYRFYTKAAIKNIPQLCSLIHVLSLYTCVVTFPLLVVDINAALSVDRDSDHVAPQTWIEPVWYTVFASTYVCAWVLLPVAQSFTEMGEFTWQGALWHAITLNAKTYLIIVTILSVLFAYILILYGAYTSLASVWKIGISLANAWGLFMLIVFMPYGLVEVPRRLLRAASPRKQLLLTLFEASEVQEKLDLAAVDLAGVKAELLRIDPLVGDAHRVHLHCMLELIQQADRDIPLYRLAAQRVTVTPPRATEPDLSLHHLETLHATLKFSVNVATRANYHWGSIVRKCDWLDGLISGTAQPSSSQQGGVGLWGRWWWLWLPVRNTMYYLACVLCTLMTVLLLWSELVLPFRQRTRHALGVIELIMNSRVNLPGSFVTVSYMVSCSFFAALQLNLFDAYVAYPSITDNASFCFNVVFLVRLLVPLCFNFLLISGLSEANTGVDVMYGHVYARNMDISVIFGNVCNRFLPVLIPFVSLAVYLNLTRRALAFVGVEVHYPSDMTSALVRQRIDEGRKLVEHDLHRTLTSLSGSVEEMQSSTPTMNSSTTATTTVSPAAGGKATEVTITDEDGAVRGATHGQRYRDYVAKRKQAAGIGHDET